MNVQSRERFEKFLEEFSKTSHREFFTKTQYEIKIAEIETLKNNGKRKSPIDYHTLSRYDVMFVKNERRLIVKRKNETDSIIYFAHAGQIYEIIKKAHEEIYHAGIKRTDMKLRKSYKNVHRELVDFFIQNCIECQEKNKKYSKNVFNKNIYNCDFFDKGFFCLIDFQHLEDMGCKYVLYYQDQKTKFTWLRAIQSPTSTECAQKLFDIFIEFNPPLILYSEILREFVVDVVKELKILWPSLKLVHGHSKYLSNLNHLNYCENKKKLKIN